MDSARFIKNPKIPNIQLMSLRAGESWEAIASGDLCLFGHHFLFDSKDSQFLQFLYTSIDTVQVMPMEGRGTVLLVSLKNFKKLYFYFPIHSVALDARHAMENLKLPESPQDMFPFFNHPRFAENSRTIPGKGWLTFSMEEELKRMGFPSEKWRISTANKDFKLCPTYPQLLVVPADIEDGILADVASYRNFKRIPVVSYVNPKNKIPILRCSEPLSGRHGRKYDDEMYFRSILDSIAGAKEGVIIDTRSQNDAMAHKSKGGGMEIADYYFNWKRVFADMVLPTPHLKDAFTKFANCCQDTEQSSSNFLSKLESIDWFGMVRAALSTAIVVANLNHRENKPVVVHGQTGWDNTALVVALAQLLIDPYYRTIKGFEILIEKEWLHFGHPFSTRSSHYSASNPAPSPVFVLFLECVWQVSQQYPCAFEFNETFLLDLFEHSLYSEYGTFLFNSEQERKKANTVKNTTSLWSLYEQPKELSRIRNALFDPSTTNGWIKVSFRPQVIKFWKNLFCRFALKMDPQGQVAPVLQEKGDLLIELRKERESKEKKVEELQKKLEALRSDKGAAPRPVTKIPHKVVIAPPAPIKRAEPRSPLASESGEKAKHDWTSKEKMLFEDDDEPFPAPSKQKDGRASVSEENLNEPSSAFDDDAVGSVPSTPSDARENPFEVTNEEDLESSCLP